MNRTAGINSGAFGAESYMVSGIVSDELTNLPIENAEVKILELDGLVLTPRLTDEFGRYRRLLVDESYTLEVNAIGYESKQISFTPSSSAIYELDISLNPSQISNLNISVTDVGNLSDNIIMVINHQNGLVDSIKLDIGNQVIEYPLGSYKVSVYADGKIPQFFDLILNQTDTELLINLTYESEIYSFDFENNTGLFLEDGNWLIDDSKIKSQSDLKYSSDLNSTLKLSSPISIDSDKNYLLKLNLQYELEWEEDSLLIELKGRDDIISSITLTNQHWDNHLLYIPIPDQVDSLIELNFTLTSDGSVNYRGVVINDIQVVTSSLEQHLSNTDYYLQTFKLNNNYPNPFNPSTTISFELGSLSTVNLNIYDINGKLIDKIINDNSLAAGIYDYTFNGSQLSSGIYFYEISVNGSKINKKMLLIK